MDEIKTTTSNPETGEKTFTQEQVNAIIGERLAKEKTRADTALAEREQQIAQRDQRKNERNGLACGTAGRSEHIQ